MDMDDKRSCQKPHEVRIHNQRLILSYLKKRPTTVKDLSIFTGLSLTSILKAINYLREKGMVVSVGKGDSTGEGGKRPDLYLVNRDYKYAVGCFVSNNQSVILLTDYLNRKIDFEEFFFEITNPFEQTTRLMADKIHSILKRNQISADNVCGAAFTFDGIVNSADGIINYPVHNISWGTNIDALTVIRRFLPDIPTILIGNTSRLGAYIILDYDSEYRNKKIYVISSGSNYTGGCMLNHGYIENGSHGLLGELGHTIEGNAEKNSVYKFEDIVSEQYLFNLALKSSNIPFLYEEKVLYDKLENGKANLKDFLIAANNGNKYAQDVIMPAIKSYAILIRNIELLCDPDLIIIYGAYAFGGKYFKDQISNELKKSMLHTLTGDVPFEMITTDDYLFFSGATQYTIDQDIRTAIC